MHLDYHIELDRHYYSVPHPLVGRQLLARYTAHTVELLHRGQRVASHRRSHHPGRHTTVPEHMPEPHRRFAQQWSPERFSRWAESIAPATARFRHSGAGLKHRLDEQATNDTLDLPLPADKDNVCGPSCFH